MRSLSTIGTLAAESHNIRPQMKKKPYSMPIADSKTDFSENESNLGVPSLRNFVTVDKTQLSFEGQILRKVKDSKGVFLKQ